MSGTIHVTIGEAAEASGVSAKMIRHYERIGLIAKALRSVAGYRYYTEEDIRTLCFIRRARDLGFVVDDIARLVRLWRRQDTPSADVKELAVKHIVALRERISVLEAMCKMLEQLAELCPGDGKHDCPILNKLDASEEQERTDQHDGSRRESHFDHLRH